MGAVAGDQVPDHLIPVFLQVCSRAVGRIGREPLGLDIEALLGALDHGLRRADFSLADGTRRLDIHDIQSLHQLLIAFDVRAPGREWMMACRVPRYEMD
jgi:hypothetical protein